MFAPNGFGVDRSQHEGVGSSSLNILIQALKTPKYVIARTSVSEQDHIQTEELLNVLDQKYKLIVSEKEFQKLEQVLHHLKGILDTWIKQIRANSNNTQNDSLQEGTYFQLFTYGSFQVGLNNPGGDIDTLIVAPSSKIISREVNFFCDLYDILKNHDQVQDIQAVKEARVPLITMTFEGVPIDLAFSNVEDKKILEKSFENLDDNSLLKEMDVTSRKSIDGVRVARKITKLLTELETYNKSHYSMMEKFRISVKTLKLFAKNRGIYSNMLGYLSGITISFLVVKIFQMYPSLLPQDVVFKFFEIFSTGILRLTPVLIEELEGEGELLREQFSERDAQTSVVAVVTPAFPCYNSSKRITESTLRIIETQFKWGYNQIHQIKRGGLSWERLFEKYDFFREYQDFLEVLILGNKNIDIFNEWRGYIESMLIFLTEEMDSNELIRPFLVHLYPQSYEYKVVGYEYSTSYFYGIRLINAQSSDKKIDLQSEIQGFINRIRFKIDKLKDSTFDNFNLQIFHKTIYEVPDIVFSGEYRPEWARIGDKLLIGKRKLSYQEPTNELKPNDDYQWSKEEWNELID